MKSETKICVLGLGYVGLPLAMEFSKHFKVIGYDKNLQRVKELCKGQDKTNEVNISNFKNSKVNFSNSKKDIKDSNIFIITVPTPVTKKNKPDLSNLLDVSKLVAKSLKLGDTIVFESTVFPGCTDDIMIPILEKYSKLRINKDFYVGYSPERIDPGKSKYKLVNQNKIVSGSNKYALALISKIYSKIIKKKLFKANSIKIAEAAKIIENTQRDINIAFINEISTLFEKLGINTSDVLKAAGTKWNFLNFKPGLVGGHCISVDPYYLQYKAEKSKHKVKIISSSRAINDSMPMYIFKQIKKYLSYKGKTLKKRKILFLGISYKENCGDFRNSKAITLYNLLKRENKVDVFDNFVNKKTLFSQHKIKLINKKNFKNDYDVIVVCVPHKSIRKFSIKFIKSICNNDYFIFDIKGIFPRKDVTWQL